MFNYLDTLRQKPESSRKAIAVVSSALIVLVVGGGWGYAEMNKNTTPNASPTDTQDQDPSPLSALTQNISEGYNQIKTDIVASNPFSLTNKTTEAASASSTVANDQTNQAAAVESTHNPVVTEKPIASSSSPISNSNNFGEVTITDVNQ